MSCDNSEKDNHSFDEEEVFIVRCPPKKTDTIRTYNVVEYQTPDFLKECLDTIIIEEQKCRCYKNNILSGFQITSKFDDDGTKMISIVSSSNIIGDYSDSDGFFKYKKHYFVCFESRNILDLEILRRLKVMTYLPDRRSLDFDPETTWYIRCYKDRIISIEHYPCPTDF